MCEELGYNYGPVEFYGDEDSLPEANQLVVWSVDQNRK